jgi:hypothetical protein
MNQFLDFTIINFLNPKMSRLMTKEFFEGRMTQSWMKACIVPKFSKGHPLEPLSRASVGVSLQAHAKDTRSEPRELGFWFVTLSFTRKTHPLSFAGRHRCRRYPGEGYKWLAEQRLCVSAFGGQKPRGSHWWSSESRCMDAYTWRRLIGASKSGLVK